MTGEMGPGVSLHGSNPEPLLSALGQKRTLKRLGSMSALPPKADIGTQPRDVRFVPKADSCSAAINAALGQVLPDFRQKLTWAKRLRDVVITARLARLLFFDSEGIRGDGDNRNRL
jgi:hypothetical protein